MRTYTMFIENHCNIRRILCNLVIFHLNYRRFPKTYRKLIKHILRRSNTIQNNYVIHKHFFWKVDGEGWGKHRFCVNVSYFQSNEYTMRFGVFLLQTLFRYQQVILVFWCRNWKITKRKNTEWKTLEYLFYKYFSNVNYLRKTEKLYLQPLKWIYPF